MSFLGLLLLAIARILRLLVNIYTLIVAVAVLLSWIRPDPYNPLVRFFSQMTDPVFRKIRRRLPASFFKMGIDPTPILVIFVLILFDTIIVGLLFDAGTSLRMK
jgi:YggT family protein